MNALKNIFGERLGDIPLVAPSSFMAETLGAATAMQIIVSLLDMSESKISHTPNFIENSNNSILNINKKESADINNILVTAINDCGQSSAIILRK